METKDVKKNIKRKVGVEVDELKKDYEKAAADAIPFFKKHKKAVIVTGIVVVLAVVLLIIIF